MTTPDDPNNPNRSPFTPQVHQERKITSNTGIGQDAQRGMRGKLIESILQLVTQAITGVFLPGPLGGAFTQLSSWAQGIGQSILGPLVTILVTVLDSIPIIGPPLGDALEDLASLFGLMKANTDTAQATGQVAQGAADTANVGVTILTARFNDFITSGASFWDTFGRDLSDFSLDPDYDVLVSGGSGNPYLTSADDGRLRWNAVGFSDTNFIARRKTTPMTTNQVRVSAVINSFPFGNAGNQAHIWLMGRMDDTFLNHVIGVVEGGVAEIGYVKAGVYTRLGATESVSTSTGDLWDLEIGTVGDEWRFRLLQNNSVRVDRTDLGHVSMKDTTPGTTYMYCGVGGDCAIGSNFPGITFQIAMPDFQVMAAADF